jgi:hypothetical protein
MAGNMKPCAAKKIVEKGSEYNGYSVGIQWN